MARIRFAGDRKASLWMAVAAVFAGALALAGPADAKDCEQLTGAELASMNFWVFPPSAIAALDEEFASFLRAYGGEEKSESILPEAVSALMSGGTMRVRALSAPGPWFGLTHQADRESVRDGLKQLTKDGVYPSPLWGPAKKKAATKKRKA